MVTNYEMVIIFYILVRHHPNIDPSLRLAPLGVLLLNYKHVAENMISKERLPSDIQNSNVETSFPD